MNQDPQSESAQGGFKPRAVESDAELLRVKGPYLELLSTLALDRDGDLTVFLDFDPQITLLVKPSGSHIARLEVDHDPAVSLNGPILYVDYGQGFSQTTALPLRRDGKGRLSCTLAYPDRLVKLRFDPDAEPGAIRFERLELVPSSSSISAIAPEKPAAEGQEADGAGEQPPTYEVSIPALHRLNAELNAGANRGELVVLERIYPEFLTAIFDYVLRDDDVRLSSFMNTHRLRNWYVSTSTLDADVEYLMRSAAFDFAYYELQLQGDPDLPLLRSAPARVRQTRLVKHYLLRGVPRRLFPSRSFDPDFYQNMYADDLGEVYVDPFVHYLRQGQRERRHPRREPFEISLKDVAPLIDEDFYRLEAGLGLTDDAAEHYVREGFRRDIWPRPDFSPHYYLRRYTDLDPVHTDPLLHYMRFGKLEGRRGSPDLTALGESQARFDPAKPTVLVANHEGSHTDAPIVGLALAEHFSQTYNIITHLRRGGPLEPRFARVSAAIAISDFDAIDAEYFLKLLVRDYNLTAVMANSVESEMICIASLQADVPCLALVHEFAEHTRPNGKLANVLAAADRVILPSELVLRSINKECVRHFNSAPNHIRLRYQGYVQPQNRPGVDDLSREDILELALNEDGSPRRIVLGAGYVQMRQGVDLFLETAAEILRKGRRDVCFIWVGDGYAPDTDMSFSLWLREMVERMGLSGTVRFLPGQKSFTLALELCDVFYLPSRLDPFPNVVVDALFADKPVVCFKDGTGVAELFLSGRARGDAVPYCDVTAGARAIEAHLDRSEAEHVQDIGRLSEIFRFSDYAADVEAELRQAQAGRREMVEARDRLLRSGAFDPAFYEGDVKAWARERRAATDYVSKSSKGFTKFSPRPGFSDGLYRARHQELGGGQIPLLVAFQKGPEALATHRCVKLEGLGAPRAAPIKAAAHVHLHHVETVEPILERLARVRHPLDVFITTSGRSRSIQLEAISHDFEWGAVEVIDVPNRGRDVGPFITEILPRIGVGRYDIVGHFHSKKTVAAGPDMGVAWRNYLLDTLLGEPDDFATLTTRFMDDPRLGLVFAEDRHAVGWSENFAPAQDLAERLKLRAKLPPYPLFPLGTMFWARPEAMAPLSGALKWSDYPLEPLQADGTVLHALERLLPSICNDQGYGWETVYKPGAAW